MRALGIDYGDSRTGVALSDPMMMIANKLCVIDVRQYGRGYAVKEISRLIEEHDVSTVVIGYPLNMDGTKGDRIAVTEAFADELRQRCREGTEIVFRDERLTTRIADNAMREMGVKQKRKGVSDEIAAMVILQSYLDSRSRGA